MIEDDPKQTIKRLFEQTERAKPKDKKQPCGYNVTQSGTNNVIVMGDVHVAPGLQPSRHNEPSVDGTKPHRREITKLADFRKFLSSIRFIAQAIRLSNIRKI